ncbi:MAG: aminotransferase class I/II-fold pyridoxal phosphate-dependent enzyme [Actinobacteria bacterium]|nr:aminotransferase class I/II-fold pyridoxal phosphate-dependent enzyme [Actinomycetota bacterium]
MVVTAPAAGAHGGDGARVAAALGLDPSSVLDLSASLNPVAPDPSPIVSRHLDALRRYPDPAHASACLASAMGVPGDRLLLTNGGAEAIALLARLLGGSVVEPDFGLYPRGAAGPRWRSDPHNPTGRLAGREETAEIWDEAFYPLATGRWTAGGRAVVVGSLTKLFACPGLRLGYLLADEALVERARVAQPAWSVNGLAVAALPDLLEAADLTGWAAGVAQLREALIDLLHDQGLEPQPSDANYVLCANAAGLRERLAPHGVVVRDCASFGLVDHARIAVPDADGLARLEAALCAAG